MVDFEGGKLGGFDADNGANQEFDAGADLLQGAAARFAPGARILAVDANGAVTLPAGVTPQDITVQGRDLVINLADGTVLIIPDGAIIVPQIVIDGVAIPAATVSDLLNGIDPEAGPAASPPSSGGNFADPEGAIQDPFDLGDLLPYTELGLPQPEEEEIIPDLVDEEPEIVIITPDNPVGVENAIATVDEDGLPVRGDEPAGTRDETNSETTSGTIVFQSPDGLSAILINGVEITTIGQEFVSPFGTLTITSINLATGVVGFSYTLADNTLGISEDGFFVATVRDLDGDEASASLTIIVIDDSPIAADDIGVVAGGTFGPIFGNVLDNDEPGADDYPDGEEGPDAVTGFSNEGGSAQPGDSLQGEYGVLTLNADGSYTYVRDFNTPGDVTDVFTYTIIDQDGSTDTATLTIEIGDAPNSITLPDIGDGTVVNEGGLAPRDGEPVGTGEGADGDPDNDSDPSEGTGSTITFNSPDGLASVTINGVAIDPDGLPQTIFTDATGTLVITGFTYDPVTGDGTITYEYTLADNTSGDDTSVSFEVVVTDLDGDEAADDLVITIVDDEPEAVDDFASQDSENAPVTVDVFANDIEGADGVALDTIALVEDSLTGAGTLVNNGDGTFTYTPAPGEEGTVTFDYSITDGDGDPSVATVTIDLLDDSTPEIFVEGDDTVNESGLDGPPASTFEGSDSGAASEIATGAIGISTGGDTVASLIINGVNVTAGGTVPGAYGTLTVTFDGTDYSYSYELDDNITDLAGDEVDSFSLTVTDSDGDPASTTLDITVIDDVPLAVDDTDSLTEGGPTSTSGNVITDAEANGDNGADTTGADGATVQNAGEIAGVYGTLVLGEDGGYTYTLSAFGISQLSTLGDGEFFTEVFDYTLVDGDGDPSPATLTITLNGVDDPVVINGLDGAAPEVILDEDDLDNPGDDQGSDQSDPLFQNGSFGVTSPDGLDDVQVNGVDIVVDGVFQGSTEVANDGIYSVSITGWTPVFAADGVTVISATFAYTATLLDNTLAHTGLNDADIVNMLTVTATDSDGSSDDAVLDVQIIDDVPTANDDGSVEDPIAIAEDTATEIDVFANDVEGADGVAFGDIALETQATNGTAVYNDDGTFTYTPNPGYEGPDSFTYTITDGDGDPSTATVFVNVGADSKPDPDDAVAAVDDDGLGGNAGADAATDLDADVGDSGAGLGDESVFVGTFTADFGGDTPGTFTLAGMDGASGMVGTESVDYTWAVDGITGIETLTATGPRGVLFTVMLDPTTGEYTVTLEDNVLHEDDGTDTENDASADITFTAIDSEGDPQDATLTITFDDDVPTAKDDTFNQGTENAAVVGDVKADNGNGADIAGADSPGTYSYNGDIDDGGAGTLEFLSNGTFTYTPAPGQEGTVTFTYTLTDGDGDESTAEVTINLEDDSKPDPDDAVAAVDDDGLGGNAGADAATDLDADDGEAGAGVGDESVYTGTFTADFGGDAPGTFTLEGMDATSGMVGTESVDYTWAVDGITGIETLTATGPRGVLFTVMLDPTTGEYTVTLEDNVLHEDDGTDTENDASADITFTAIDSEGDPQDATLTITFDDDVPTAKDDTFNQGTENAPIIGDVKADNGDGADVTGADTPVSYALTGDVLNGAVDVSANLSFNSDGTFTYTPDDGEEGTVTFSYTLTDADGDESTGTVTINLEDDSKPDPDDAVAAVDDDGLGGNAGADAATDLDADDGEAGAGVGDESVYTGTFTADFGGDTPGTFTLAGMDATSGMVGIESVDYTWAVDGITGIETLTATGPRGVLFTVMLDPTTGEYTVTLEDNVLHEDDGTDTENDASADITFTAIDSEGDPQDATLTITFDDDVPTANDDTFNQADQGGENTAVTGDVSDNDTPGADGALSYALVGGSLTGAGQLNFLADGTFTYTPASGEEGTVTFSYTLTDGDGDESTAEVTINLEDDSTPSAGTVTARVDDDGLTGGNGPNVAGDDLDANTDGNDDDTTFVGTLVGNAFNDGPATFSLAGMVGQTDSAGSGSFAETISYTWSVDGNTGIGTLTGVSDVRGAVFTVTVDTATGDYTVTLLQNWLHDGGDDGELAGGVDSLDLTYTVSDSDTPTADSVDGTLTIQFGDDAPLAFTPTSGFVNDETDAVAPHPTITEALNLSVGADTPAQIAFSVADGTPVMDGTTAITVGNDPLFFYTNPTTGDLYATTGTAWNDGTVGFVVELDATGSGSYTFTVMNDLSNGTTTSFTDLTSTSAGNVLYKGVGADDPATGIDLLLSGTASGAPGTINTDSDSIGVANQSMNSVDNETLRIDFVTNLETGGATPTGFTYDDHSGTTNFRQEIPQVQGNQATTVGFTVTALDSTLTDGTAPDSNPDGAGDGWADASVVTITSVTVTDWNTGNTATLNITDLGVIVGTPHAVGFGIFVTFNSDGTVSFTGIQEGDAYEISTGANEFNAVAVTADSGSFDLGVIEIGSFNAGEDIELSFDVTVTDEDGDTAQGTINVTVDQDGSGPPVTPVVLDLDGGGNQFSSLSSGIAYDYDSDGTKSKTAWIAAGSAILAYDANGDGIVNDASEFVFGGNGMTDLEAIAAKYDTNGDGKLDANDSTYGKFGVWIDGDLDAVSDPGEFVSLADAGITSIDLVSDGIQTVEADGDVTVFGTSSFTWADGSTGEVSDAGFTVGADVSSMMEALLALGGEEAAANDNSGVVAGLQGAQELPDVAVIVDDVMADGFVDAVIDQFAGDHNAMAVEASHLDSASMALKIVGDAFAFGANPIADMHEDAAALVAANA